MIYLWYMIIDIGATMVSLDLHYIACEGVVALKHTPEWFLYERHSVPCIASSTHLILGRFFPVSYEVFQPSC